MCLVASRALADDVKVFLADGELNGSFVDPRDWRKVGFLWRLGAEPRAGDQAHLIGGFRFDRDYLIGPSRPLAALAWVIQRAG